MLFREFKKKYSKLLFICVLLLGALPSFAQNTPVTLTKHVTDRTGTLSADELSSLEARLSSFEKEKGSQVAVLMVPTTDGQAIEEYTLKIAEHNKLGRKGVDDAVLIVVAKNDRRMRIETGYGVEGIIPDAVAFKIIDSVMKPKFRNGDFHGGISGALDVILPALRTGELPPAFSQADQPLDTGILPVAFFASVLIGQAITGLFGKLPGALIGASIAGIAAATILPLLVALFIGAFVAFVVFSAGVGSGYRRGYRSGYGRSSWGSSSSRGGGFSGSGGRFGGGGASGSW